MSCKNNDYYVFPSSIKLAKEKGVFVKEFVPKNQDFLIVDNEKIYFNEIFICYKYNAENKINEQAVGLVFVFKNSIEFYLDKKIKKYIMIKNIKYDFMVDSSKLIVPLNIKKKYFEFDSFTLNYEIYGEQKSIEFIAKQ